MKALGFLAVGALFTAVAVTPVWAESPTTATDPHHPVPLADASASSATPAPSVGEGGMPMEMCRHMMGGMSGMPGMGGATPGDSKEKAEMLRLRAEMMKAMADVMMRHARRMEGPTEK